MPTLGRRGRSLLLVALMVCAEATAVVPAAAQAGASTLWQAGPDGTGDDTYVGSIDLPQAAITGGSPTTVAGWLVDTTAQGWSGFDQVQIYSGPKDGGGALIATATVGQERPDVGAALGNSGWNAAGFSAQVPASALPAGIDPLYVYGHTSTKGWWYTSFYVAVSEPPEAAQFSGPPTVSVNTPALDEHIPLTRATYAFTGSAADPKAGRTVGSGVDRVSLYFYAARGEPRSLYVGDAALNGTDWSLTLAPGQLSGGYTALYVYAHSRLTGQESMTLRSFYVGQ